MERRDIFAGLVAFTLAFALVWTMLSFTTLRHAFPRDLDGHWAQSDPQMHAWFNQLASKRGLCCSFADGLALKDVDWRSNNGHYEVRIAAHSVPGYNGATEPQSDQWVVVPDSAIVTENNRFGAAVVWPFMNAETLDVRCFLPGAGT